MSEQNPSKFGTYQSLSRMALLFKSQTKILDDLLEKQLSDSNRHVTPLLGAIRDNCKAILLFEKASLLNESILIQRLFVQRIINCCYLLYAARDEVSRYLASPMASSEGTLRDGSANTFIEFAKNYNPKDSAPAFQLTLLEQVDIIAAKTGIPKDLFSVALASVFPKSSEILAGSLYGTAFQFGVFSKTPEEMTDADHRMAERNGEFFYALLMGINLLDALFKTLAKCESTDVDKKSAENTNSADQLTLGLFGKVKSNLSYADGAWERLDKLEFVAAEHFANKLSAFGPAFRDAYDVGLIVPTLKPNRHPILDLSFSALFLKRVLNDLRGVWLLLNSGYTSQAASIAASLYESALAAICLSLNQQNIDKFRSVPDGRIPWNNAEMARRVARADKTITSNEDHENLWRASYKHYTWLCEIKHSSLGSIISDSRASSVSGKGYVVMAIPNLSEEDIKWKASIAVISLIYTLDSVKAFANALGYADKLPDDLSFAETYRRARESTHKLFSEFVATPPVNP